MVEFISLHRNTLVPGPESDTVYTGEVITQGIGGTTEPEIIVMHVPKEKLSEIALEARNHRKTSGRRVTITTGGYSRDLTTIGKLIHWVDYSKWRYYLERLKA